MFEHEEPIAIEMFRVDAVNGALLGLLLRALSHGRMPIEAAQLSRNGSFLYGCGAPGCPPSSAV